MNIGRMNKMWENLLLFLVCILVSLKRCPLFFIFFFFPFHLLMVLMLVLFLVGGFFWFFCVVILFFFFFFCKTRVHISQVWGMPLMTKRKILGKESVFLLCHFQYLGNDIIAVYFHTISPNNTERYCIL